MKKLRFKKKTMLWQSNPRYILFYKSLAWLANSKPVWPNNSNNISLAKYLNILSKTIYCDESLKEKRKIMSTSHDQNVTLSFIVRSVQILAANILKKKPFFSKKYFSYSLLMVSKLV